MDSDPLISVIIPVYNIMEYLPRCVRSVMAQSYSKLEILLVDDGSTDGTGALCDELAAEDSRIRVYHKDNGGSSSARNLALKEAKGEYVGFVDSDDYIEPDMYARLLEAIQKHGVSAAQIGRDEIDEQGNRLPDICTPPDELLLISNHEFLRELLLHRGDCSFCTKLIRRDLFPTEGFPAGKLNEDFHLLLRMLPGMGSIVSLPGQAYHVFYRIGSNSRKADKEDFSPVYGDCVENADMVVKIVERDYPQLEEEAFRFGVFQRLEYMLHIPIPQMRRNNLFYRRVVSYLRKNWARAMGNQILTRKNKIYHTLFALAPKTVRRVHAVLRGRKGKKGSILSCGIS